MKKSKLIAMIVCLTYGHIDQLAAVQEQELIEKNVILRKLQAAKSVIFKFLGITKTFASINGLDYAKEALQPVVNLLKNPQVDDCQLTEDCISHGVLLVGGSAEDRKLLARAVVGEADCAFFDVKGTKVVDPIQVKDLFRAAYEHAAAVIFIDDIDVIGNRQIKMDSVFWKLLEQMSVFHKSQPVVVIGSTNKPNKIDFALKQHGRFGRVIYCGSRSSEDAS